MMRAAIEEIVKRRADVSVQFYTSALELLTWGSQLWKDVPLEQKGAMFRPGFIRTVKVARLRAYLNVRHLSLS